MVECFLIFIPQKLKWKHVLERIFVMTKVAGIALLNLYPYGNISFSQNII